MTRFEKESLKVRILKLAELKCTGSPADLAFKFDISERSIKRIVKEIREDGNEIRFCQIRRSYVLGTDYY
jgi:biotin operon repressor